MHGSCKLKVARDNNTVNLLTDTTTATPQSYTTGTSNSTLYTSHPVITITTYLHVYYIQDYFINARVSLWGIRLAATAQSKHSHTLSK